MPSVEWFFPTSTGKGRLNAKPARSFASHYIALLRPSRSKTGSFLFWHWSGRSPFLVVSGHDWTSVVMRYACYNTGSWNNAHCSYVCIGIWTKMRPRDQCGWGGSGQKTIAVLGSEGEVSGLESGKYRILDQFMEQRLNSAKGSICPVFTKLLDDEIAMPVR